jgi:hypothetical protein
MYIIIGRKMPVINLRPTANNSVNNEGNSSCGDLITNTTISGISFIQEELTKQIAPNNINFLTTYNFVGFSLEVFINGIKQSPDFDFIESPEKNGFSLVTLNTNFNHWINNNTCILVKYIKTQ